MMDERAMELLLRGQGYSRREAKTRVSETKIEARKTAEIDEVAQYLCQLRNRLKQG